MTNALTFLAAPASNVAVTKEMLEPVLTGLKDNLAVIIPVGIAIFAIMIGIRFVPRIFKMFTRG